MPTMNKAILLALLSLPLVPLTQGCLAAVGVGAGLVLSQEMLDNDTYVTRLNSDVRNVWPTVKTTLSGASLELIQVDEELRVARAKVDGANVTVSVEAYDIDKSILRVMARKYGMNNGEVAGLVHDKIVRDLDH